MELFSNKLSGKKYNLNDLELILQNDIKNILEDTNTNLSVAIAILKIHFPHLEINLNIHSGSQISIDNDSIKKLIQNNIDKYHVREQITTTLNIIAT